MYLLESNEWCDEVKCISSEFSVSLEFEFSTSSHDKAPILLISWPRNKTRNYIYTIFISAFFPPPLAGIASQARMWAEFQSISISILGYFSEHYGQLIPSGCSAVLRGDAGVVFRGDAPSRLHSSFGLTSSNYALSNSVFDCKTGRLENLISCVFLF